jgi:hypothetical protein
MEESITNPKAFKTGGTMLKEQLSRYAEHLKTEQQTRDKIVNKGRLAYRMGIELRNNPEKLLSAQKLWETGWEKERESFTQMMDRWKRN